MTIVMMLRIIRFGCGNATVSLSLCIPYIYCTVPRNKTIRLTSHWSTIFSILPV